MNTRTEIHCGCGASLTIEDSPGNLSWVTTQIEAFWVDHTHRCQDPEELDETDMDYARERIRYEELMDQVREFRGGLVTVINETREELNKPHSPAAKLITALNAIDRISNLMIYGPGGAPTTTSQSPGDDSVNTEKGMHE